MIVNPSNAPFNAVGDGITDDTAAWNAAVSSIRGTGGIIEFSGAHKVTTVDFTNLNSVILRGQGGGVGGSQGARIICSSPTYAAIDAIGSQIVMQDFEVINPSSTAVPVGIILGQINGFPTPPTNAGTLVVMDRIFTKGKFSISALYSIAVGDSVARDCRFWNSQPAAPATVTLANCNRFGVPSAYVTPISGEVPTPPFLFDHCEIHDFVNGVMPASGCGLLLVGVSHVSLKNQSSVDSSSGSQGGIICLNSPLGVHCGMLHLQEFNGYSENNLPPYYGIYVVPGSTLDLLCADYWRQTFVSTKISGTITQTAGNGLF